MTHFRYQQRELYCEGVPASSIAEDVGTPVYVYSRNAILDRYRELQDAFPQALICYSVKANANLAILSLLRDAGAGFDVVSGGELYRALAVGADPEHIVFAGVGKREDEILYALRSGVGMLNVESENELSLLAVLAKREGRQVDVALRINPDVDPATHRYITTGKRENKFGVDLETARSLLARKDLFGRLRVRGIHVHIGSQITSSDPYVVALARVLEFISIARGMGHDIDTIDLGGGFGIDYGGEDLASAKEMAADILPLLAKSNCRLVMEPGRFILGNAGILLTRVLYVKDHADRAQAVCDAGMNDLLRPSLYDANHKIWPVRVETDEDQVDVLKMSVASGGRATDVVGPLCETGDFLGLDRFMPGLEPNDLLSVFTTGAYGSSMASNYNSRPRPAEVLVTGKDFAVVTRRETYEDLVRREAGFVSR